MRKGEKNEGRTTSVLPYCLERASKMQGKGGETKTEPRNFPELRRFRWDTGKANVTRVQKAMY